MNQAPATRKIFRDQTMLEERNSPDKNRKSPAKPVEGPKLKNIFTTVKAGH